MGAPTKSTLDSKNDVISAARIFEEHGDYISKVIHFHVKDKSLADDFYQELFLSLVIKPIPKNIKNVKSYLYRLITNRIIDAIRRIKRYQAHIRKLAEYKEYNHHKENPEKVAIDTEETELMFKSLERHLTGREAKAIRMRYLYQYKTKMVATKPSFLLMTRTG